MRQFANAGPLRHAKIQLSTIFAAVILAFLPFRTANAQSLPPRNVTLTGNHPAEAVTRQPVAHANSTAQLNMDATLSLRNTSALEQLLRDQQNPSSPRYHHWLTPEQFTAQFGPTQQDADTVAQWLSSQGFHVTAISLTGRYVRFTGSVADAEHAFGTDIMAFGNGSAYSNITDPMIPAQFAGVVVGIRGLSNFLHSYAFSRQMASSATDAALQWNDGPLALLDSGPVAPLLQRSGMTASPDIIYDDYEAFGPSDFRSFYDEDTLISSGITGSGGDCLAIVGDSDYTAGAVTLFNSTFGLPASKITTILTDVDNPGTNDDELESLLDLEWSHVAAPGTPVNFYLGNDNTYAINPIVDCIQAAVTENLCGTISVSFGLCGVDASFLMGTMSPIYSQAASQGQTVFISAGDNGAAGLVLDPTMTYCVPGTSLKINEIGADPNVTTVGRTSFVPNYDGSGNNIGNVPESAWNDGHGNGATGGGVSAYYPKPSYQAAIHASGAPSSTMRYVPDIALVASPNNPGVFLAAPTSGPTPTIQCCIGGTSLSAPTWAGFSKLIAQLKHGRLGPLNPTLYSLAQMGQAAVGLRDVTTGNNSYNGVTGYDATVGFDLTSGWGTADFNTFAHSYISGVVPTATPTPTPSPTPSSTPKPTRNPTPTPTFAPPPVISSISSVIDVGGSFVISGSNFSASPVVNLFVATASGPINAGPLIPSSKSSTKLTVAIPVSVPLGQGFAEVQVVNTDQGFKGSNDAAALLQGSAAAGIPTLTQVNGVGLASTSSNPDYAVNNVKTVIPQGSTVNLTGTGFDAVNGVAVNVFCACTGGKVGPFYVSPGPGLTSTSFSFTLPADVPTGPGSIVVINRGADASYSLSSNGVSVPIGAAVTVTSVSQTGTTITVKGTGFSTLTVINLFNQQGSSTVNLGGLAGSVARIPLTIVSANQFRFTEPASAVAGPAYVQAINPPFLPYTSSGSDPGGAFTLK